MNVPIQNTEVHSLVLVAKQLWNKDGGVTGMDCGFFKSYVLPEDEKDALVSGGYTPYQDFPGEPFRLLTLYIVGEDGQYQGYVKHVGCELVSVLEKKHEPLTGDATPDLLQEIGFGSKVKDGTLYVWYEEGAQS